ncbi:unnamed protein product [Sphagnum jensenii]|uniref:Uncharacterized protein n=1 Tax=Sphagnum jensenii TaxID=128206 RepID=A0ABP0W5N4_9BRYO
MNVENQGKYIERKCTSKSLFAIKRSLLNRSYIPPVFPSCSWLWLLLLTLIVLLSVPILTGLRVRCLCGCSKICWSHFRVSDIWIPPANLAVLLLVMAPGPNPNRAIVSTNSSRAYGSVFVRML